MHLVATRPPGAFISYLCFKLTSTQFRDNAITATNLFATMLVFVSTIPCSSCYVRSPSKLAVHSDALLLIIVVAVVWQAERILPRACDLLLDLAPGTLYSLHR